MEIRGCRCSDLADLEWDGEFTNDRRIIDWAFARTLEGTMVMLVAVEDGAHAGQLWIDFARWHGVAHVWALRVKPAWRRRGVGTQLLRAAERVIEARDVAAVELEVEPANAAARRLYERRGYVLVRSELQRAHDSGRVLGAPLLVLRKMLAPGHRRVGRSKEVPRHPRASAKRTR